MRRTWISIALLGCISVSAACTRDAATRASQPDSAIPPANEMHLKRDLLQKYSLPDALELETVGQMQGAEASRLEYPISLASSDDGAIYISDNNGHAIYHATPSLKELNKLTAKDGPLQYPNTIQVRQNEIYISDNDGIKVFGRDGSFLKLLRIYYSVFHFTVDSDGSIFANPLLVAPKDSDALIVALNEKGMRVGNLGKRMNRTEHDGLDDRTYLCTTGGMVIVAFKHRPLVQIYDSKTRELVREIDVTHPVFPDLAKLAEDKSFVNPKKNVVRLPVYISGVDVTANRIYVLLCLPQPEIVEFSIQGQEIARYRAESSVLASNYFGFRARSTGNAHQFTLGLVNPLRNPVMMALSFSAKTLKQRRIQ